jgi:hypothetical protein
MVPSLLWADLTLAHLERLDQTSDDAGVRSVLLELCLSDAEHPQRQDVLLQFFANLLNFARQHGFSAEKISTLFSLMKRTHSDMVDAHLTAENCYELFKTLLLAHSVQRPPYSVGIFTLGEVKLITAYARDNYFRHFKLFRYGFTLQHERVITLRNSHIEQPPSSFAPLSDGVPFEPEPEPAQTGAEAEPAAGYDEATGPLRVAPIKLDVDLPPAVLQAVQAQLTAQMEALRASLEGRHAMRIQQLEEQLAAL